ncbi:hypothetical protein HYV49_02330 [Candidatus Pacearchaeota archaeon]|nr:hypothetical protein [Candidatus Pacearchaeota archaeon]
MAKSRKKKEEINLDELDINQLLNEAVATSRLGRALASLGATLTGREKHDAGLVYLLLKAGKEYSGKFPVVAEIKDVPELKKYTPKEAIDWFAGRYPKEAGPLLKKLEEEYTKPKTEINYGLRKNKDLSDSLYIETLSQILNISDDRARVLYHGIIKPYLDQQEEESKLVSITIKEN